MIERITPQLESLVSNMLLFADRVVVVSPDLLVRRMWPESEVRNAPEYLAVCNCVTAFAHTELAGQLAGMLHECFREQKRGILEFMLPPAYRAKRCIAKAIPAPENKDLLVVAFEVLPLHDQSYDRVDFLKEALEITADAVWEVDYLEGTIEFSAKWYRLFGYEKGEISTLNQWADRIHPDDQVKAVSYRNIFLEGKSTVYAAELRFASKDGSYKWLLSRGFCVNRSSDGSIKKCIGTHTDITERKAAEQKVNELHVFYENILHNIPADLAVFSKEHEYLFVNRNAYKNEELRKWIIGKTDADYAVFRNRPASFYQNRFAFYDRAIATRGQVEMIEPLVSRTGEQEYHLRIVKPVYLDSGEFEFLVAYGLNVTELIKAQEALKLSADTFSAAFNYSGIGMALVSPLGKWLDVNEAFLKMTGYSKEELLVRTFQDITYEEDLEADLALLREMLRKEITTYTMEKRYVSKQDKIVWVILTVSLVWSQDGSPRFFIAQVVDITQKKELEQEIRRKNLDLQTSEMSLLNKIEQLEQLSHVIAHNLRGPAGNIMMLSELLMGQLKESGANAGPSGGDPESVSQMAGFIQESSAALMASLNTLMELSEIKLNTEVPFDDCDLRELVESILRQLQNVMYETHGRVNVDFSVPSVLYPKAYLEHILYNLVSNALKYYRPGVPPQVLISSVKSGDRTVIKVRDNGLGIDMERFGDQIFKLNQVFHKGYDSKGIGLFLTRTQIESLGGTISVKSWPGEGSEFTVTL